MLPRLITTGAAGMLLVVLASGCSKSTTAPIATPTTDPAQVGATLDAAVSLVDDALAEDPSQVSASGILAPGGSATAIRPFTWWQSVNHETRDWSFAWADTDSTSRPRTCIATLTKHMTGSLIIVPVSPSDSTQPDTTRITKPLDKTLTRMVMLKRLLINGTRQWRVVEVTGAFVHTPGALTSIQSLHLHSSSGVDTTVTSPLQWFSLRHVIRFTTNDTVTVTATTLRNNDAVFIHRWDWRHRLHNNGDGTYSFTWVTSSWGGWRHFGIQAMAHGSIYDDALPFDMQAWHLPFRVAQPDVDYYP